MVTTLMEELGIADTAPALLPERIVELAERLSEGPAGLYVVDIEGASVRRLAGPAGFPAGIGVRGGLGPELGALAVGELQHEVETVLPGGIVAPLWVRGRATAVLLATQDPGDRLGAFARAVAPRFELASGYSDVVDRARRVRRATTAAELQQDLLAPRIAAIGGGEVAGSLLPAYDVGGDWFDHAENPEGAWLTVADAMGKGLRASAVSALALAALRGSRRAGDGLEQCCQVVHEAVAAMATGEPTFVTVVIASWHAPSSTLAWVCCGHPPPLLVAADGSVEELRGPRTWPLGLTDLGLRTFERAQRRLRPGDRVVLYSDGITERRTAAGRLGLAGLVAAVRSADDSSAVATVAAIERAVLAASRDRVSDDATQLVLRVR